jgi:hypothetical protein
METDRDSTPPRHRRLTHRVDSAACSANCLDLRRLSQVVPAPVAVIDHGEDHPEEGAVWVRDPVGRIG